VLRRRPLVACLLVLAALPMATGCASVDDLADVPPAAGAAPSPPPGERPEGRVVPVGRGAEGVAVDALSGLVAVAVREPAQLGLLDLTTLRVVRRVALPGPARHVALAQAGGPFLVPVDGRAAVVEVPSARRGAPAQVPVDRPAHDAVAASGRTVVGDGVALVPGGPVARVLGRERRLELVDPRTGSVLDDVAAGVGPTHVTAGDDGRTYVADTDGGSVLLIRTRPELVLARRVALPGAPYGVTVDREKGKLWVTLTAANEVVQLTAEGQPREQRRYPTVRQPNSVAIHEPTGRVFVTGTADGVLQVLDGYAQAP
jgi:DNA-binding beta-propeller fold protein YncE